MKTDKEYPATHSMSTAWYMVDDDDNVAIIQFENNGPIPVDVPDTWFDKLLFGPSTVDRDDDHITFSLTDDQLDEVLENLTYAPTAPDEEKYWDEGITQIDPSREEEFLALCREGELTVEKCVSRVRGLYLVDYYNCFKHIEKEEDSPLLDPQSVIRKLIDRGIIFRYFSCKYLSIDDNKADESGKKFRLNFESLPYYLYQQPYNEEELSERVLTPRHPVKLSQVPEEFRSRIHRIPGRFAEKRYIQIAQHTPCRLYGGDGISLSTLPSEEDYIPT